MEEGLVPANTKKSMLIFGMFRLVPDLIILIAGIVISVGLLLAFSDSSTWILLASCIPMFIGLFLVIPIPNYHNTLCVIESIINFYTKRRKFIWKGWCIYEEK